MLHAGLDLSRRRLDVCMLSGNGKPIGEFAVSPDADGLRSLAQRLGTQSVRAVIESMNVARFVHDTLEGQGWEVLVADAQKVKGLAPLACKTDRIFETPSGGFGAFDAVACNEVLYLMPDPGATIAGELRPGAHLFSSIWRHPTEHGLHRLLDQRFELVDANLARNVTDERSDRGWRVTWHRQWEGR